MPEKSSPKKAVGVGADADHRAGETGFPQQAGRRIGRGAFLHGQGGDGFRGGQVIGGARMGQDAADFLSAIPQQGGDGRQTGIVGAQTGPVPVAIYLQQHGQTAVTLPGKIHQQPGAFLIVQHHAQVYAAPAQFDHTLQFVGSDTDGVTDVAHTACGKIFGFRQCGDRGRAGGAFHAAAGDLDILAGLEMGPQGDAALVQAAGQPVHIGLQLFVFQQQAGRGQRSKCGHLFLLVGNRYRGVVAVNVSGGRSCSH